MNKYEFNQFVDSWIEEINHLSLPEIELMREDLKKMSSLNYAAPDDVEFLLPMDVKKYSINTCTHYVTTGSDMCGNSRSCNYQPQSLSATNKARQACNIKPAA